MDNYKEYLNPKDHYIFVKWPLNKPVDPDWIEIPEDTEIIRMNCEGSLNFYKKIDGHWAIKNKVDMENWYQPKPYSSHFDADDGSLPIIWQRSTQDQGLISGAEALRALADGKDVQVSTEHSRSTWDNDTATYSAEEILAEETAETDDYNSMKLFFRLKPQTIKLELELPKPFEPQIGDRYWIIHPAFKSGYTEGMFSETDKHESFQQFGAYRTEDDVKKAVEQLRKIRGAS